MKNKKVFLILAAGCIIAFGLLYFFVFRSKQPFNPAGKTTTTLANPASVNCEKKGGTLTIEKKPTGGEYGVCVFEDNRQCEEWALFRNECPKGGVKITGLTTNAQKYCAIVGGTFSPQPTADGSEKGTCTLPDGSVCDADEYYQDTCPRVEQTQNNEKTEETIKATFLCKDNKSIDAEFNQKSVSLKLSDGRTETLNQALSASGARYANKDESFVFWNKGDTAFIEEQGTTTYSDCVQKE